MVIHGSAVWVAFAAEIVLVLWLGARGLRGRLSGWGGIALIVALIGVGVTGHAGIEGHDVCYSRYGSGCTETASASSRSDASDSSSDDLNDSTNAVETIADINHSECQASYGDCEGRVPRPCLAEVGPAVDVAKLASCETFLTAAKQAKEAADEQRAVSGPLVNDCLAIPPPDDPKRLDEVDCTQPHKGRVVAKPTQDPDANPSVCPREADSYFTIERVPGTYFCVDDDG